MNTLLLIDGNGLIHRAFHALPDFRSQGIPTGAVYGFISTLHKVITEYTPTHVITCFDTPALTFRDKLFPAYRAQRPETDKGLIEQFPIVKEFLESAGLPQVEKEGLEADDLIGILATRAKKNKFTVYILTGDKDIFQLVGGETFVITPQIGFSKEKKYDREAVIEKLGVPPERVADLKALAGDSADNYKGIPGIGPKTASVLINQFGNVEEIYKNIDKIENQNVKTKLIEHKDIALLSKRLAELIIDDEIPITIEQGKFTKYNDALSVFFQKYNFRSLSSRLMGSKKVEVKKEKKEEENQLGLF